MYCSSCGVVVTKGLSYCNFCGAKLNQGNNTRKSSEVKPDLLVSAMVATFMFGLGAIAVLMGVMKAVLGLPVDRILGFMALPFLLMLILEGIFIRLLLRRTRGAEETREAQLSKEQVTNELAPGQGRVLSEPMPSVTEHTTRAFEPIYKERTSK